MQGEGRIFQLADSVIVCEPFEIPAYWTRIVGLDLGHGDHPTAAAWLAIDRDTDTIYVHKCYRRKGGNIPTHAEALKTLGRIPVAWPHDGNAPDKFEGTAVKKHYQNCGVNMLSHHAMFPDGSLNVWQGVVELQQRMEQGRFKVFSTCFEWFEEFRNYHMEKGKIVKIDDDLLCATRYGMMMMRQAKPVDGGWRPGNNRFSSSPIAPGTDFDVFDMK